jgi:hypothetical protein
MTTSKRQKPSTKMANYAKFLEHVELEDISLGGISAEIKAVPKEGTILRSDLDTESRYETKEGGFTAFVTYRLKLLDPETKKQVAKTFETFVLQYRSEVPMTDEFFEIFDDLNLPLHTWPYFRELTHNVMARMNLPRMVVPTLKLPLTQPSKQGMAQGQASKT